LQLRNSHEVINGKTEGKRLAERPKRTLRIILKQTSKMKDVGKFS
jgi:hypothetical protein